MSFVVTAGGLVSDGDLINCPVSLRQHCPARFLKISPNAAYKLVERRQVPHIRLNRKVLFDPQTIRNWLNQHAVKSA